MNGPFNSQDTTINQILHSTTHHLHLFPRNYTKKFYDASERRKNTCEDGFRKIKLYREENLEIQSGNEGKKSYGIVPKSFKLYPQQNISDKIDRILSKNALSPITSIPNVNTSIEQTNYFTNSRENMQRQRLNAPFMTQNVQIQRQDGIKSRKTNQKRQMSQAQIRESNCNTIKIINSYRNRQFSKINIEQYKLTSGITTPSQNQWQNSMNLIKLEKRQSEKNKKYCRIMIRRINTDQIFTKRAQNHHKITSNHLCQINNRKRTKPIRNIMSQATPIKKPKVTASYENSIISDVQNIGLNPWSTTEIQLRQQNDQLNPF